jgi:MOSC domain-containing protein YiiM
MMLRLLSVNLGRPAIIGVRHGEPLISAIRKVPAAGADVFVGTLGIAGDAQANLLVHGGADKAVYAYPADHWLWWQTEKNFPCTPGRFGENLTLEGADESAVHIGDHFAWGDAILEISQPRSPCEKFQVSTGREDASALMTISGRCGWYLRVVREGRAPLSGAIARVKESGGPSVRAAFLAAMNRRSPQALRDEVAAAPALAGAWRDRLVPGTKEAPGS